MSVLLIILGIIIGTIVLAVIGFLGIIAIVCWYDAKCAITFEETHEVLE